MEEQEVMKDEGPWPFELVRRYEEVGPEVGQLYEARNVVTGSPALVLFPSDRVIWKPAGPWHARLSYHPTPVCVSLDLEQAPPATKAADVVDSLVLLNAASQLVEDNPRFNAHFTRRLPGPWWTSRWAVAGFAALMLVLDVVLVLKNLPDPLAPLDASQVEAPVYSNHWNSDPAGVSYPMPSRPFRSQALPPCLPSVEVEINGGCWIAAEQRPPCNSILAEHEGKCYLPVHKKEPVPQSQEP